MGVTGLWKLIEPCGKPVPVETLEGKILAIDISIWLHQVIKGFQDSKGSALPNAHLLGLFHRLCKLLYYRVKPIFVFDGCVPQLKKETIARRQQQRSKLNTEAERIQALLLQSLAKEKVVQQALGANVELLLKSPTKRLTTKGREDVDDIFKLPELPTSSSKVEHAVTADEAPERCDSSFNSRASFDDSCTNSSADDSSSFDESNARNYYSSNLQAIDVKSHHFRDLPADVRHEILVDIKETRKQSSWGRLHELPSRGDDFSVFQMKRLLKRRAVQESLEEAEQEMGGKTLTYAELTNIFTEEGILETNILEKGSKHICSDEHTRFLLVRDLKKKFANIEEKEDEKPCTSEKSEHSSPPEEKISTDKIGMPETAEEDKLENEFDTELQLALAMSLEDTQVYSQSDYQYEPNEQLKLNRAQRTRLQNAVTGPARAYMIEYGGMNEEEVEGIMEKTQLRTECEYSFDELCNESSNVEQPTMVEIVNEEKNFENTQNESETEDIRLNVSDDSDTDTDLEEVTETIKNKKTDLDTIKSAENSELEIVLDLKNEFAVDDDLFADIFESNTADNTEAEKSEISEKGLEITQEEKYKSEIHLGNVKEISESYTKSCVDKYEEPKPVITNIDANSILCNLKAQLDDVKNITLDDIKIESSIIELSDDESARNIKTSLQQKTPIKTEVIEICDSDDALPIPVSNSKSPNIKTPQKNRSILEYYQADYVVKRTPDKPKGEETEDVPKVTSPFFVNRTPKSSRKRTANESTSTSPTPKKSFSKASKSLFENNHNEDKKSETNNLVVEPILPSPVNTEDLINKAAQNLKEQKTEEELQTLASDLAKERMNLENERNRQDRMGMSISQRMSSECQELLRLFGIPYIVAPMEAEAQCAFLDSIELTNGTITDDSDIWLFGGRTVYKNFFAQNKHVLEFRAERIENTFNCDRKKLIQLACLVGSDYTTGVHGIGAVTALEILASFTPVDYKNKDENMRDIMTTVLSTLNKFRDWWIAHKSTTAPPGSSARLALRKKLKNIELNDGFPSLAVVEAYLVPKVDESRDAFSWGYPDVESIREYAKKTFGWTIAKTNEILTPVLKRLNEKKSQATIRNYFTVKSALSVRDLKVSKRVQKAIDRMSGKIENETPEKAVKPKVNRTVRNRKKQVSKNAEEKEATTSILAIEPIKSNEDPGNISVSEDNIIEQPTTSKMAVRPTRKRPAPNLHNKKTEVIPQREKDNAKMAENKAKAAEILKKNEKTASAAKKKR